jgi:hypothetical protein
MFNSVKELSLAGSTLRVWGARRHRCVGYQCYGGGLLTMSLERKPGLSRPTIYSLTMTHAFFLIMGGFVYEDEDRHLRPITIETLFEHVEMKEETQFLLLGSETVWTLEDPRRLKLDKAQVSLINNSGKDLPHGLSSVEFKGVSDKGIYIVDLISSIPEEDITDKSKGDGLSKIVAAIQVLWFVTQCISRLGLGLFITEIEVITVAYAALNGIVYWFWRNKPLLVDQQVLLYTLRAPEVVGDYEQLIGGTIQSRSVDKNRSLWYRYRTAVDRIFGFDSPETMRIHGGKVGLLWAGMWNDGGTYLLDGSFAYIASAFGAIHCAAWNLHFPSVTEKLMWRIGAVMITCLPWLLMIILSRSQKSQPNAIVRRTRAEEAWCYAILPFLYIIFRLLLLALALAQLRRLPPDAFTDFSWASLIPHI